MKVAEFPYIALKCKLKKTSFPLLEISIERHQRHFKPSYDTKSFPLTRTLNLLVYESNATGAVM